MKIQLLNPILDYNNEPLKQDGEPVIIKNIFILALNNTLPQEFLTAEQKNKSFQISLKIANSDEPDFTLDDRTYIKERAEKVILSPLVLGRVLELLEDKTE